MVGRGQGIFAVFSLLSAFVSAQLDLADPTGSYYAVDDSFRADFDVSSLNPTGKAPIPRAYNPQEITLPPWTEPTKVAINMLVVQNARADFNIPVNVKNYL